MPVEIAKQIRCKVRGRSLIVAVVDEDEVLRRILRDLLESLGFSVYQFSSGVDALKVSKVKNFDIVFLSWRARGAHMAFNELVRADGSRPNWVVVSGVADTHSFMLGVSPVAFIFKPFDTETALRAILEAIGDGKN